MSTALCLLILEDDPYDTELMIATLEEAGYVCQWERVETQAEFLAHLDAPDYDLILADYSLPAFDGLTALKLFLERDLDLPFVLVSGTLGEEIAIESLKAGATDYVLKDRLSRLGPVVRRALREREEQRQRKQAEEALERRATQLALLNDIGGRIAAVLELDSVLEEAAHLVQEGFGYHHVALFTIDRERGELLLRARADDFAIHLPPDHRIELGQGMVGWVGRHGEKLLANDVSADPRYVSFYPEKIPTQSELSVPLRVGEEVVGVLDVQSPQLNAFDENEVVVMETLADQIAAAIQNAWLYEAERAARERLRDLAGYLETAREEERTYIAREIHDDFGQALTALKMDLAWLTKRLPTGKPRLVEKANAMSDLIDATLQTVRRVATDLRPGLLDHLGLVAAMEWQAQEFAERAGFDCELLLGDEEIVLDPDLATAIFRIFQETLTNVVRHAEATEVRVVLEGGPDELVLIVRDNGRGITQSQASGSKSLGLIGMQERARSWGGDVTFQAVPGQGTTVTVRVPQANAKEGGK